MMPNSRQACLKSSFCLVIYAILLLLSQYIFSLDLREDELPQFIGTVNLNEIGLKKYFDMSYKPLALKVDYFHLQSNEKYWEQKFTIHFIFRHFLLVCFGLHSVNTVKNAL